MITQQLVYNAYLGAVVTTSLLFAAARLNHVLRDERRRGDRRGPDRRGPDRRTMVRPRCFERRFELRRGSERRTGDRRGTADGLAAAA